MPKTVTLRMGDDIYRTIKKQAEVDHRPLANYIEHILRTYLEESCFTDDAETMEILANEALVGRLKRGSRDAAARKGRFVA